MDDARTFLDVDVVFGQRNGMAAAEWTRCTIAEHPQLPHLVRCVKAFLRRDGLNDVSRGGLGSHALTVAVACYLTQVRRDCNRGEDEGADEADGQGDITYAGLNLGGLLVGLMTSLGSLDISDMALSIRHGGFVRKPKEWMTPDEYEASGRGREEGGVGGEAGGGEPRLGVEDPLVPGRNLCGG